jgi:hypothetical protein
MQPLTELLRARPDLAMQYELTAGLASFQADLLRILAEFLGKKETKSDDRAIVGQGLSIWMSCIASEPQLLSGLYSDFAKLEKMGAGEVVDASHNSSLLFASLLVEKGLASRDPKTREAFANAIRFIVESISSPALEEPPLRFFLRVLLQKLDHVQRKAVARDAKLYFALLRELLPRYFDALQGSEAPPFPELFAPSELLKDVQSRLLAYEPTEKRGAFLEDFTLIGLIEMIAILIEKRPDAASEAELGALATVVLERCLFSLNFGPID